MKLGTKIPYGWPIIITAIIAAGTLFSFSEEMNPGYGFIPSGIFGTLLILAGILALVAAIIFLINSFAVEKELKKSEKDREERWKN